MCGIFGKINFEKRKVGRQTLVKMSKTLKARGPDDVYFYSRSQVGFGATRLAIIDLKGGRQPLSNEKGDIWAAQNGEIYNYQELKKDLEKKGHKFKTNSDSEVIVHLYEEKGLNFVNDLRGMFAIVLWDEREKQLLLVRDRIGIKPLYYCFQKDSLVFASEPKAILATGIKKEIDRIALHDYLSLNYIPGGRSIFTGIKRLVSGHFLLSKKGKVKIKKYWSFPQEKGKVLEEIEDEEELSKVLLEKLKESVKSHLIADVPVGIFLSGGLDSSTVAALASMQSKNRIKTFSVGFVRQSYDETKDALKIAKKFKTDHTQLEIDFTNLSDLVEKVSQYFDEPFADSSALAVYLISRQARKKVKVILTGDGGDEVFGGYVIYLADQMMKYYQKFPRLVKRIPSKLVNLLPVSLEKMSFDLKLRRFTRGSLYDPVKAHFLWRAIFTEEEKQTLYINKQKIRETFSLWQKLFEKAKGEDLLNKFLYLDSRYALVDDMLTKVDRMSMANSLEVRVPLLDYRLVGFVSRLPSKYKVRDFQLKYLFKKTMEKILPKEIVYGSKKGFHVPAAFWLKKELKDLMQEYLSPKKIKEQGVFNPEYIQCLIDAHLAGKADYSRNLWGLLMFSLWYENYYQS